MAVSIERGIDSSTVKHSLLQANEHISLA